MATVQINGVTYTGSNISISGSNVIIDGVKQTSVGDNVLTINVTGGLASLSSDRSVTCEDVEGDVKAGGSVSCGDVQGNVSAGGSVSCGDIGGSVKAGGSISGGF